jgi:hypothetical protein
MARTQVQDGGDGLHQCRLRASVINKNILRSDQEWEGMDWIPLSQDGNKWQALVYAVMNLRVRYNAENILAT